MNRLLRIEQKEDVADFELSRAQLKILRRVSIECAKKVDASHAEIAKMHSKLIALVRQINLIRL